MMRFSGRLAFMGGGALLLGFLCLTPLADPARRQVTYGAPSSDVRIDTRFARKAGPPRAPTPASVVDNTRPPVSPLLSASSGPPPPSPGIPFARTSYDYQHNASQGYQVGRLAGADIVHFCWMHWGRIPADINELDRKVRWNSYSVSLGDFNGGVGCWECPGLCPDTRAGYTNLAVGSDNTAHVALHQYAEFGAPYTPWQMWFPSPGSCLHLDDEMPMDTTMPEILWPRIAVNRNPGGTDIVHILAHVGNDTATSDRVVYWRYDGVTWYGPAVIDSSGILGYVLAADPNSDRAAIVLHTDREPQFNGMVNIAYYESQTEGAGWISGVELGDANKIIITNYTNPLGPEAYQHISTAYDNAGRLHIIWDEPRQSGQLNQIAIRHWNSERADMRLVVRAYYDCPLGPSLCLPHLSKMTLGIGDGATLCNGGSESNLDYLYVVYTKFAGETPAEQADYSALGEYNGELHLIASRDGGTTWSRPVNLTNTKTPNCKPGPADPVTGEPLRPDSVCRSENWATIGQIVHDIDIFFISDLDAGGIPAGEGTWQMNPVHYLRLPGGTVDAPYLCLPFHGILAYSLSSPEGCGFHADSVEQDTATLTLRNTGPGDLSGTANAVYTNPAIPPAQWLSINSLQSVAFSIQLGGPDTTFAVVMNPSGLVPGTYTAELRIAHDDLSQPSPVIIPITFNVAPCECHGDPQCDGWPDAVDVTLVVGEAFRSEPPMTDPTCPHVSRADLDCNCVVDVRDVVGIVDRAFRGFESPVCNSCKAPCL